MVGFLYQWVVVIVQYVVGQFVVVFYVVDYQCIWVVYQYVGGEQYQQVICVDDFFFMGDYVQVVVIVIEGQVDVCVKLFYGLDQVFQIVWVVWIRVMIWEGVIYIVVQGNDVGIDCFQQWLGQFIGYIVVGIGYDFEWVVQLYIVGDVLDIVGIDFVGLEIVWFGGDMQLVFVDVLVQFGDCIVGQCFVVYYDFEFVVVWWVVVVGNCYVVVGVQVVVGEVYYWCGCQVDVDDIVIGVVQVFDQFGGQIWFGQMVIVVDYDFVQFLYLQY